MQKKNCLVSAKEATNYHQELTYEEKFLNLIEFSRDLTQEHRMKQICFFSAYFPSSPVWLKEKGLGLDYSNAISNGGFAHRITFLSGNSAVYVTAVGRDASVLKPKVLFLQCTDLNDYNNLKDLWDNRLNRDEKLEDVLNLNGIKSDFDELYTAISVEYAHKLEIGEIKMKGFVPSKSAR